MKPQPPSNLKTIVQTNGNQTTSMNVSTLLNNHELITTSEVRKLFGISKKTVYRWQKKQLIMGVKWGGRYYFSKTMIEKVFEARFGK